MGAASLHAHMDWFAPSSPCKSRLPRFKPEQTREGAEGWKCPLFLCMDYCAVSHSARRKQLSMARGMDSVPEAQLHPDLRCPALWLLLAGDATILHTFLPSSEKKQPEAQVPKCFA